MFQLAVIAASADNDPTVTVESLENLPNIHAPIAARRDLGRKARRLSRRGKTKGTQQNKGDIQIRCEFGQNQDDWQGIIRSSPLLLARSCGQTLASRPNPRFRESGREVCSPRSLVRECDGEILSTPSPDRASHP
jgi:hypothetical protein